MENLWTHLPGVEATEPSVGEGMISTESRNAGKPHVRFDERGRGNAARNEIEAPASGESRRQQRLPRSKAGAPPSTLPKDYEDTRRKTMFLTHSKGTAPWVRVRDNAASQLPVPQPLVLLILCILCIDVSFFCLTWTHRTYRIIVLNRLAPIAGIQCLVSRESASSAATSFQFQ